MIHVRTYEPNDEAFILGLAPRLTIGMRPWRDRQQWIAAASGWLTGSIREHERKTMVFVAENEHGSRVGFATVSRSTHFTGQTEAYIGELVTVEAAEGQGVGSALVKACEGWAREQGFALLTLTTGAANDRALRFYHHLGFQNEEVKLTKLL